MAAPGPGPCFLDAPAPEGGRGRHAGSCSLGRSFAGHKSQPKLGYRAWGVFMKTAAEYRAMAEDCFEWASATVDEDVRASYLQLGQIWLDAAHKLDGLSVTPAPPASDERKKAG